jgi:hypothetical protein
MADSNEALARLVYGSQSQSREVIGKKLESGGGFLAAEMVDSTK